MKNDDDDQLRPRSDDADPASSFSERLDTGPQAAGQARSAIRRALAAWGMTDLSADAELLASELVANSSEHAPGSPIGLVLRRHLMAERPDGIVCEVSDSSPVLPQAQVASPAEERGRGLAIVAALADDTGVRARPDGKTTWFALALSERARRLSRGAEPEAGA